MRHIVIPISGGALILLAMYLESIMSGGPLAAVVIYFVGFAASAIAAFPKT